ncbi:hypothetical protein E2C01_018070 [Portunus trituberculatus]|uniref:Uncharacterized protein n=1 Tax=Portunus trituberculatus TaxID=210409 RepID=A0A5B7DVT0_PORTR|nr:hypothetical protein [Portunus trituberculatus]
MLASPEPFRRLLTKFRDGTDVVLEAMPRAPRPNLLSSTPTSHVHAHTLTLAAHLRPHTPLTLSLTSLTLYLPLSLPHSLPPSSPQEWPSLRPFQPARVKVTLMWNTAGGCPVTHLFNIQARGLLLVATTASLFTFFPPYTWSEKPPPTSHTYHCGHGSCTLFSLPITPGRPNTENTCRLSFIRGLREQEIGVGPEGGASFCVFVLMGVLICRTL